ncbi:flagellar hook protein FlgE [Roseateles sp. BYS78W]|uniref:Flagellar hook protein FlgE n=1 Tax=Pelomonas candidula TaxID=3299025 RepID=A0ABW7HGD2_9BURK
MSFEIALAGISAVSSSLDQISNNIANAGTYGYKSSRANFQAVYADGQTNGAEVGSVTQSMGKVGGIVNTGKSMDAMIGGQGFFAVRNANGQVVYTRVGQFNTDKDGFVVDATGRKLQGYAAVLDKNGQAVAGAALGALGDLKVPAGQIGAQATTTLAYSGNLSADWTAPANPTFDSSDPTSYNSSVTSVVYDSLGKQHTLTQYFVSAGIGAVNTYYSFDGAARKDAAGAATPDTRMAFDTNGQLTGVTSATLAITPPAGATFTAAPAGAAPLAVAISYTNTTAFSGDTTTLANTANGYTAGILTGTAIGEDGSVVATYSNGLKQTVGTVALATFADENALTPLSGTSWGSNNATGPALFSQPGAGAAPKLAVGSLEQSNVDVTSELVSLMTSQQVYQANAKVISTQSQMMQSLMQAV